MAKSKQTKIGASERKSKKDASVGLAHNNYVQSALGGDSLLATEFL